jgi:Holliday junction resolvasome RuvABC endonuclease subunit
MFKQLFKKNILILDLSKRSTGYVHLLDNEPFIGSIVFKKKVEDRDLYKDFYRIIKDLILMYNIDFVFIEDYAYSRAAGRQLYSAEVRGIVKLAVYDSIYKDLISIPISTWKAMIDNKDLLSQKKNKKTYIKHAGMYYNQNFLNADEVDAYLMYRALCLIADGKTKTDASKKIREQLIKNGVIYGSSKEADSE